MLDDLSVPLVPISRFRQHIERGLNVRRSALQPPLAGRRIASSSLPVVLASPASPSCSPDICQSYALPYLHFRTANARRAYNPLADHGGLLRKRAPLPYPAMGDGFLWCAKVLSLRPRFLVELPLCDVGEDGAELRRPVLDRCRWHLVDTRRGNGVVEIDLYQSGYIVFGRLFRFCASYGFVIASQVIKSAFVVAEVH